MSKGNICSCILCKSKIFTNSLSRHYNKCIRNDIQIPKRINLNCDFCGIEFSQVRSTTRHQLYCKKNPNRRDGHKSNQYIKAEQLGLPKLSCSEKTKTKLRDKNLGKNSWWFWKENVDKIKKNHSNSMLIAVKNHPKSYSTRYNPRTKKYGINFDSSWEIIFYDWCILNKLKCIRCHEYFPYIWNNTQKNYFPDFFLPELNSYVEVKGYETLQDLAKWSHFKNTLIVLRGEEITKIKNNEFLIENLSTFIFNN